jgi:hypothetical protein
MHRLFIFPMGKPGRRIREVEAEVTAKAKRTWATIQGRQYLLGSTAFYTRAAAERARHGYLVKLIKEASGVPRLWPAIATARAEVAYYDAHHAFATTRTMH